MAKRRPNGAGSITRRKDGTYHGRAYVTTTEGVLKRVSRYGKTYDEVAEKLAKLLELESKGVPTPDKAWKVGPYLTYWLAEIVQPNQRPTTYDKYESMARLHLIPKLGTKRLTKLGIADVRTFLRQTKAEGVGASTRLECMKVLRNALNRAMREELLLRNVASLVDMPSVDSKEIIPWSAQEAIDFLRSTRPHRMHAAFVLALVLGLRRGELLGLRWIDLDLDQGVAHPRKQVQRQKGAGLVLVDLKTEASKGALPLPLLCIETLGECRRLRELEKAKAGEKWTELGLVFGTETGGLFDPDHFSQTFQRRVKRSRLRRVRLHDTRHTCGSLLAWLGVHPKDAQKILRHSQIKTTLDIYTHVTTESQRAAAAKISAKLRDGMQGR
ncbi:tyrosine-type recombinase/integrase [Streptomyces sp. H39-S7]|uniref:tyrosine-type recombinase/integrase n=1 Tax=Streptomyces sp. H39-S7 TaxID=3004357 RepID=UPI0022AFD0EF|nr:site-specific integrase [Streptomyces sp. H39-S7]MCZ4122384.1 site-specific integrase [Streptomyces sp. H39-S7]